MILTEDKSDDVDAAVLADAERPCRLCGTPGMTTVFDLGDQVVGSYFPTSPDDRIPRLPLVLAQCRECELVQLTRTADLLAIHASGAYGYRSGQNPQMAAHLTAKATNLYERYLSPGDVVCDIGCNDGTFLGAFPDDVKRVGFDPSAPQFAEHIPANVEVLAVRFRALLYQSAAKLAPAKLAPAKLITSLSCLYDLEDPVAFAKDIAACLVDGGVWHTEQCYLPSMVAATSYDTICHEHLAYYTVATLRRLCDAAGMDIIDVELNDVNGGSFAVTARKRDGLGVTTSADGARIPERRIDLSSARLVSDGANIAHWRAEDAPDLSVFALRSVSHKHALRALIRSLSADGKRVGALGASTKGNTLLQWCGFGPDDIEAIGEINPQKVGRFTPGTHIPIVAEDDVLDCDYLLVLPHHFRTSITERMKPFLAKGGRLIFPLPTIEVV